MGRFLDFVERDGREYVTRSGSRGVAAILAIDEDDHIVLVEQHRVPVGRPVVELPAGLIGDDDAGESALDAARRELREETGFDASHWTELGTFLSSAGLTDEAVTFFLATGLSRVDDGGGVEGEDITVRLLPRRTLREHLRSHDAVDAKVFTALALAHPRAD